MLNVDGFDNTAVPAPTLTRVVPSGSPGPTTIIPGTKVGFCGYIPVTVVEPLERVPKNPCCLLFVSKGIAYKPLVTDAVTPGEMSI